MPELPAAVKGLAETMVTRFTPPSFVPGCEVQSIADIDEYATDNGWIEAIVGGDNQQRVRYYGTPQGVAVNDFVDVEYFPAYKLYRVFGATLGGTAVTGGIRVNKVWDEDFDAPAVETDTDGLVGIGTASPAVELEVTADKGGDETRIAIDNQSVDAASLDETVSLRGTFNSVVASQIVTGKVEDFTSAANRTSFLAFWNRLNGTNTLRMTIDGSGNIGIGSTAGAAAPDRPLLLEKSSNSGSVAVLPTITVRNTNQTGASFAAFTMEADDGDVEGQFFADGNNSFGLGDDSVYFRTTTAHPLAFGTNGTPRVLITSAGNMGIGTVGPDAKLDILSTGTQLRLTRADGTVFSDLGVDASHNLTIKPSSTGKVILQPTSNSVAFVQVLPAAGGDPVLNIDTTNSRVAIGNASPAVELDISKDKADDTVRMDINNQHNSAASLNEFTAFRFTFDQIVAAQVICGKEEDFTSSANRTSFLSIWTRLNGTNTEYIRLTGAGLLGINGVTAPSAELDVGAGAIQQEEMSDPGPGAANTTRTYAEDSGGTTRQQVQFSSGNAVTIAQDGGLQTYTPTNVTTDRSYDANATSVAELADVLGTLIADFQAAGVLA